ncbi:MAG TPA: carboxypeptidase regulatory-like domain-containing protein [Chloroflexota bacterium]
MQFGAASTRSRIIVTSLVAGILGLAPGLAVAQSTPVNPTTPASGADNMVARCDLPVLDLFNPNPGDLVLPGNYLISGVALDPQSPEGSGIDMVSFYLGPRDQGGVALGNVVPSGGQHQSDFSLAVDLPSADPGTQQQLVGYAHSTVNDRTTQLSIPIVIGRDTSQRALANPFLNSINTNPGVIPANCAGSSIAPISIPNVLTGVTPGENKPVTAAVDLFGTVVGSVSNCQNGAQQPASLVIVQASGTTASTQTDEDGAFLLTEVPAPGTYTISVSDAGATAARQYVPVAPGETIDVGTLELGASLMGCGDDDQAP